MNEKFQYKYCAPTEEERNEINSIMNQYLPKDKALSKLDLLRKLDKRVKSIPTALALSCGTIGILLFGSGLTFFLEWIKWWFFGIPLSIIGIAMMCLTYPLYTKVMKNYKNKYGQKIIQLSNELLNEE